MPESSFSARLKHGWDAFRGREPTNKRQDIGSASYSRPDRSHRRRSNEMSIVNAVYTRVAIDVAAIAIRHVRLDETGSYEEDISSGLNYCLTSEANLDQTSRAFIQDIVMSLFDEGCVAVVPVETTLDPMITGSYDIQQLRTGKILEWYPQHVQVSVYNEKTGLRENLILPKKILAIIENPLYAVMNEPNGTLQRLIRTLNSLDSVNEQSSAGKLDVIVQLPFVIKSEQRRLEAEKRRKDIEMQLSGTKYGIAYIDGTERITQLNRPAENNLMLQVQYLTSMLYSQLGITEAVFDGTADEATMLNYTMRTLEPILSAIIDEFKRKFLTRTARTQRQSIMYFREIFKLVPANQLANVADKYTRNEILSSNEVRGFLGMKPSKNPKADELRNANLNPPKDTETLMPDDMIRIVEAFVKTPEAMDTLDPEYKEILSNVIRAIGDKVK